MLSDRRRARLRKCPLKPSLVAGMTLEMEISSGILVQGIAAVTRETISQFTYACRMNVPRHQYPSPAEFCSGGPGGGSRRRSLRRAGDRPIWRAGRPYIASFLLNTRERLMRWPKRQ